MSLTTTSDPCSFCGVPPPSRRLVLRGAACCICDECIGLCCEILSEELARVRPDHVAACAKPPALHSDAFEPYLGALQQALREVTLHAEALRVSENARCSFCSAAREDVARLISGPRVWICERCIGDASLAMRARILEAFEEIWAQVGEKSLVALINGDRGWLMYLEYEGDAGFSSRNPNYVGPPDAMIEYRIENGQDDRFPASWAYPTVDVRRALEHFRREGTRPPFIEWHRDCRTQRVPNDL